MVYAYAGLGSNLGDRENNIKEAIGLIKEKCRILKISSLYETAPVGYKNQGYFLNCALKIKTDLKARELLEFFVFIEKKLGRIKVCVSKPRKSADFLLSADFPLRIKNGPRIIDLDILFYGNGIINEKGLTIPHPRLHERLFVLQPLKEISKNFVHPILKKSILELHKLKSGVKNPSVKLYKKNIDYYLFYSTGTIFY